MTPIIEDSILNTDLNCQFNDLLNVNEIIPAPPNLVASDDPRLTDGRVPLAGSVVDASVSATAGIVQSKLNLNGVIPIAWLGTTATTAAQGNLAEYLSNKNQPLGYCGLDATGKVPSAQLPGTIGTGTVTSVGLSMPATFTVTGSPVTSAGTLAAAWATVADLSWFGNKDGAPGTPKFYTSAFPVSLIPNLDASIVTSGVFAVARIPVAVGLGSSHAPGAVPDPGTTATVPDALSTDYLARDMTYRKTPVYGPVYQPVCPGPTLIISTGPPYYVTIQNTLDGASMFWSLDSSNTGFLPATDNAQMSVNAGQSVYAYTAKSGYTNSVMAVMPAPFVRPDELIVTGDPSNPTETVLGDDSLPINVGP